MQVNKLPVDVMEKRSSTSSTFPLIPSAKACQTKKKFELEF